MKNLFHAGILQMNSVDSWDQNLTWVMSQLNSKAFQDHVNPVDCIFLPENCLYLRIKEGEQVKSQPLTWSGFQNLRDWSKQNKIALHLGSVPIEIENQLYNSSLFIDSAGQLFPSYQKIHLFDIQLENQKPIRESDVFSHGSRPEIIQVENWNIGQSICYDIRFSELYSLYAQAQVDIIVIPAAFLQTTGEAHWHVLNRARAIESQAFILSACQTGEHHSGSFSRKTYGHSLVVNPWGEVLLDAGIETGLSFCTLDRQKIIKTRTQIPMKNHRRLI
ncbi:MAG: nitrilase-related carbon-nitrogen hydrolase [Pseudobdellovibrionaceae bacterium]|jgi:predicted amidohydrolase